MMRALDVFFRTVATLGEYHPENKRRKANTRLIAENIAYLDTGNPAHTLDLHAPKEVVGPLPVLLYMHGGGFRILSKDTHRSIARRFAQAGYLVVNINYRLTPAGHFPHALQDACGALHWILDHIEDYGGDPKRLVYAGESAGGNLSLALAMLGCFKRPEPWAKKVFAANPQVRAVLPACGILEVHHTDRYLTDQSLPRWVRSRIKVVCDGYRGDAPQGALASPLHLLESDTPSDRPLPPIFSICGDADYILSDTERLGNALEIRKNRGGVKIYPRGIHAFHVFFGRQAKQAWKDQFEFLKTHLSSNELGA